MMDQPSSKIALGLSYFCGHDRVKHVRRVCSLLKAHLALTTEIVFAHQSVSNKTAMRKRTQAIGSPKRQ